MKTVSPNVLWIQADEFRPDALGCYGSAWARTPALDAVAARGVVLRNAVCPSPVCLASRTAQLCAQYPQEWGLLGNMPSIRPVAYGAWSADAVAFPSLFRAAGYQTAHFGRSHNLCDAKQLWDEFVSQHDINPEHSDYENLARGFRNADYHVIQRPGQRPLILAGTYPGQDTPGRRVREQAVRWLRTQRDTARPFLLRVSFNQPHTPVLVPEPFDRLYDPATLPCQFYDEAAYLCRPRWDQRCADAHRMDQLTNDQLRQVWKDYMGLAAYVDHEAGQVLQTLDELGLRENTIVMFSADHGKMLGEWGFGEKATFDRSSFGVPFIWSWPGHLPTGEQRFDPCNLVDTGRTLLTLAGLAGRIPAHYEGQDLFGSAPRARTAFGAIYGGMEKPFAQFRAGMLTEQYRLDVNWNFDGSCPSTDDELDGGLYDHQADPVEKRNLFGAPALREVRQDLLQQMAAWMQQHPCDRRMRSEEWMRAVYLP